METSLTESSTEPAFGADRPASVATARHLVQVLGHLDVEDLRTSRAELAAAIVELADDAGVAWPPGPDDPVVAMLRALAKLAIDSPDATSEGAASLIARHSR